MERETWRCQFFFIVTYIPMLTCLTREGDIVFLASFLSSFAAVVHFVCIMLYLFLLRSKTKYGLAILLISTLDSILCTKKLWCIFKLWDEASLGLLWYNGCCKLWDLHLKRMCTMSFTHVFLVFDFEIIALFYLSHCLLPSLPNDLLFISCSFPPPMETTLYS